MTGTEFMEGINYIDDDLIFETENWTRRKSYKIRIIVGAAAAAACLCLAIGLASGLAKEKDPPVDESELNGCMLLPGGDEIYPTILVNGTLYEWRFGKAIIEELPAGSVYYGKIFHAKGTTPVYDRNFVSVFPASGRIFVDPNEDLLYLELTTDWLENTIVIFEPISESERYQYEHGLIS